MSSTTRLARLRGSTTILAAAALAAGVLAPLAASAQQQQQGGQPAQRPAQRPAQPAPAPAQPAPAPAAPAAPAAPGAAAGAQAGPTVVQLKSEPSQTEWTKVCGRDQAQNAEVCYTTRDFVSDQGQPVLAVAVYDVKTAQPQRIVRFLMPLGLLLQPGIRFAPDTTQATAGRYAICFPNGCFAEAPVSPDTLNALKKGTTLNVSAQNQVGREVTFAVPLAGFPKAFDGPAIDPKQLEEQQRKLQSELEKRSDELRRRLETSAGGGAAPGAAPAAPR
jgi:invasion protein IalB